MIHLKASPRRRADGVPGPASAGRCRHDDTPWNHPISMPSRNIAPTPTGRRTVVVTPAEQTPVCAVETVKLPGVRRARGTW
ncbi:aldehyde dehydrogenase family protein [Actinomadura madurae]|uniref:aldehyde dehydrogenase family protein n=1 Tax=Actinomadura madurae TaxID=1993 RepID=UPI003D6B57A7